MRVIVTVKKFLFGRFSAFSAFLSCYDIVILLKPLGPMVRKSLPSCMPFMALKDRLVGSVSYHPGHAFISTFVLCQTTSSLLVSVHTGLQGASVNWYIYLIRGHIVANLWDLFSIELLSIKLVSSLALGPLLHQHSSRLQLVHLVRWIAVFHLLQKLLALQKQIPAQIGSIFLPTHDVSGFVAHLDSHQGYLVDLFINQSTCLLISSSLSCIPSRMVCDLHLAKLCTRLIRSFFSISWKKFFRISS